MDPKFADRMSDLSVISPEILEQRWAILVGIAKAATKQQQARLVVLACGGALDRDKDEWLWQPFRENEPTLPVDEGAELFTRLAECATRFLISSERRLLPAMLVRLACNAEMHPFGQDLIDASVARLTEPTAGPPRFTGPGTFWTTAVSEALQSGAGDPPTIAQQVTTIANSAQAAVTTLSKQVVALTSWANEIDGRFAREQSLIQWLLNGIRSDGSPWTSLPAGAVAVDAAEELAQFVEQAPQARHEASLAQVLLVADRSKSSRPTKMEGISSAFELPQDDVLIDLLPVTVALAKSEPQLELGPIEITLRLLWEITTSKMWNAS